MHGRGKAIRLCSREKQYCLNDASVELGEHIPMPENIGLYTGRLGVCARPLLMGALLCTNPLLPPRPTPAHAALAQAQVLRGLVDVEEADVVLDQGVGPDGDEVPVVEEDGVDAAAGRPQSGPGRGKRKQRRTRLCVCACCVRRCVCMYVCMYGCVLRVCVHVQAHACLCACVWACCARVSAGYTTHVYTCRCTCEIVFSAEKELGFNMIK